MRAHAQKVGQLPLGIFATYPGEHLSVANGFFDQVSNYIIILLCQLFFCE